MRNPGTDFHRRQADAEQGAAISRRNIQRRLNAFEWLRRGQYRQALLEHPENDYAMACKIRAQRHADILAKIMHPSQAPASPDGVRA